MNKIKCWTGKCGALVVNELPNGIVSPKVTAIINARIAGKSSTEIKALVIQLEAQRLNACEVNA